MEESMAAKLNANEKKLVTLINKMPVAQEKITEWTSFIDENGLTEEVADEIRTTLSESEESPQRTLQLVELNRLVKQWRLSKQANQFGRRR
jgi:Asp-tRNA(Asn)/Glu-tRNA(Gln) amidotransferase B subunit